jgi:DNA-directed RNA polymerase subunit M/transcription elongation factor TFIIS
MDIRFKCDTCGQPITAPEEMSGQIFDCPNPACGRCLAVPFALAQESDAPTISDDIEFSCPYCQHLLVVDKKGAGLEVSCPECGKRIVVPKEAAATSPAVTPPPLKESVLYYYADATNQPAGPYASEYLRQLCQQGVLHANSYVLEHGSTVWKPYATCFPPAASQAPAVSCGAENGSNNQAERLSEPTERQEVRSDGGGSTEAAATQPQNLPPAARLSCPKCFKTDIQEPYNKGLFAMFCVFALIWEKVLALPFFAILSGIVPMTAMGVETINSIVILLSVFAVYKTWPRRTRCKSCGHRWKQPKATTRAE